MQIWIPRKYPWDDNIETVVYAMYADSLLLIAVYPVHGDVFFSVLWRGETSQIGLR